MSYGGAVVISPEWPAQVWNSLGEVSKSWLIYLWEVWKLSMSILTTGKWNFFFFEPTILYVVVKGTGTDSILVTVILQKSSAQLRHGNCAARFVRDNKSKVHGQVGLRLGLVTASSYA